MKKLSIDLGFGDTKVVFMEDGDIKSMFKETNAIASLGSDATEMVKFEDNKDENMILHDGEMFYLGSDALELPDNKVITIDNYETLKEFAPLITKKYLNKFGHNVDKLIVTISIAYERQARDYMEHISKETGYSQESMEIIPQGVGCKIALENIGLNTQVKGIKDKYPNYLGIDIGFNTIDVFQVINNTVISSQVRGFENEGVIKVARDVREVVADKHEIKASLSRIRQALYDGKLIHRGKVISLTTILGEAVNRYNRELFAFLEKNFSEEMNTVSNVILFGGGSNLIGANAEEQVNDMLDRDFILRPINNPEYYNAIGGLYV